MEDIDKAKGKRGPNLIWEYLDAKEFNRAKQNNIGYGHTTSNTPHMHPIRTVKLSDVGLA